MSDTKIWNKKNGTWESSKRILTEADIEPIKYNLDVTLMGMYSSINVSYTINQCIGYRIGKIFYYHIYLRFINSSPFTAGNWAIIKIKFPFDRLMDLGNILKCHFNCFFNIANDHPIIPALATDNNIYFRDGSGVSAVAWKPTDLSGEYKYSEIDFFGSFIIAE